MDDAILVLNPDAMPQAGCLDRLREPPAEWDAWMGVVTLPAGTLLNARYLQEIRRFPMLAPEEEFMLAKRWREH